uniref:Uncharacterized protein n=1 Tax=Anguilla anguilla TaxID=7936 RepID=A0A0E9PX21_ANGAN
MQVLSLNSSHLVHLQDGFLLVNPLYILCVFNREILNEV